MKGIEESGPWVVYRVAQGDATGAMFVCQESDWETLRVAGRSAYELVRNNILSESEAERFARGTSGNSFRLGRRPRRRSEPASGGSDSQSQAEPRAKILVVDDNVDAATSLAMLLRLMGHTVCTAYDGLHALAVADSQHPDVMLLDIGLPKLNGYEVAKRIRAEPWGRSIPLIALSGWTGDENRERALAAGFDEVLAKPVDYEALAEFMPQQTIAARPAAVSK